MKKQKEILSYEKAIKLAKKLISDEHKEHIICIYLDSRQSLIKAELIGIGLLNNVLIHPREIFRPAIKHRASNIILLHNHPSSFNYPSKADIAITRKLEEAGEALDIEIIDHIIFTKNKDYFSFKEELLL